MEYNPLHCAAISGKLDKARKLLQSGKYDVNMKTGVTALVLSCAYGHIDMVRMLISEFKADVNIRNRYGDTPLHNAERNGNEDIVLALIQETSEAIMARHSYIQHVLMDMLIQ